MSEERAIVQDMDAAADPLEGFSRAANVFWGFGKKWTQLSTPGVAAGGAGALGVGVTTAIVTTLTLPAIASAALVGSAGVACGAAGLLWGRRSQERAAVRALHSAREHELGQGPREALEWVYVLAIQPGEPQAHRRIAGAPREEIPTQRQITDGGDSATRDSSHIDDLSVT